MANIVTIKGDLRAVSQLVPGSFQHWDELSADRITDPSLRDQRFYTADYPQYHSEQGEQYLALARHTRESPNNLVLRHLFDKNDGSYDQLVQTGSFRPDPEEARAVLEAADTLKTKLSALRLSIVYSTPRSTYVYLSVRTSDGRVRSDRKYLAPNEVEKALLERVGITEGFLAALQEEPYRVSETRLYFLNPGYVAEQTRNGFVGQTSQLCSFICYSHFNADGRNVSGHNALRGVRKIAEGGAPENEVPQAPQEITLEVCYKTLAADRQTAVAAMNDKTAAEMSAILTDYLVTKTQ